MKRFQLSLALAFALTLCTSAFAQNYSFQTVDVPNDTFTQLLGINNGSRIAGYHNFNSNQGFTLKLPHSFTTENFPGAMMTQVIGINDSLVTDGFYVDTNGVTHGFYRSTLGQFTTVDYPGTPFNQLLGQNEFAQAAGYYSLSGDNTTPDFPYIYDENGGVFEVLTIPGAVGGAQATGVNNYVSICGFFIDAAGVNHGFLLNYGYFSKLDFPGSTFTQALGLNNRNQVVGDYMDSAGLTHGFLYNANTRTYVSIDDPSGIGATVINGINDVGTLVGFYGTTPINHGFVATPE